ncbi:hypothetical protein [Humibacillus xanthopallidus]|uniref:hypothetical protein n=1 Tax=Humibacillus xanthopallidus TaxID=412689 RepID=UPI00384E33DA
MTLPTPGDPRPPLAGVHRWLLGMVTLALAIGVVVMHSLGVGHHGPTLGHHDSAVSQHAVAQDTVAQDTVAHDAIAQDGVATMQAEAVTSGHSAGHGAAAHDLDRVATPEPVMAAAVGSGPDIASTEVGHGSMAVCLAVLPLLLLLHRLGDRAWFARAQSSARRHRHGLQTSWLSLPPGRASPSLSELCILRT